LDIACIARSAIPPDLIFAVVLGKGEGSRLGRTSARDGGTGDGRSYRLVDGQWQLIGVGFGGRFWACGEYNLPLEQFERDGAFDVSALPPDAPVELRAELPDEGADDIPDELPPPETPDAQ